jgi:mRNA interferase RelE/StbE
MERYEVLIKPSAVKEIERVPKKRDRQKVVRRIQALADDPRPSGCERLAGSDHYRVRQGWYRIVYAVDDAISTVRVVKVGHRRDVYRS